MKIKKKFIVVSLILFVSLCFLAHKDVQAVSVEEAGQYIAEFAINFFDSYASKTKYGVNGRATAYQGSPSNSSRQYIMDCVGWLSFAVHQSTGLGNSSFTEFAVPFHEGSTGVPNNYPGFFNGFQEVYGEGGSSNKIPLNELKQQLKPGDLLMCIGPRKHVLLYVGDNTLIHSTGHGPGSEYGGDSGYGLVKESLDHFYQQYGIEAIGRLTESAAASINQSNLTTIFGQSGSALTGRWQKASEGGNPVTSTDSTTQPSSQSNKFTVSGMNEDYTLGLRYPKDNSNTPLNSFIDFTLPYLQTWMIPLAMNSGALNTAGATDKGKNPVFSYITIKEAMSDILVNRYDITKCTLKTKYKVYDVITYQVSVDSEGNKSVSEIDRYSVDESKDGPMAEQFVSKTFDVTTKYCIKKAHTFDVKIDNEYTYNKYSDSDVENRINPKKEDRVQGENYHEGGDPGGDGSYTYIVKDGYYMNVTRIWEDEFEIGESKISEYTVDDVQEYISTGSTSPSKTTVNQGSNGTVYNCKKYELTEEQLTRVSEIVYGEYGYDIDGAKNVASHMANLYEYRVWSNSSDVNGKSFYDWVTSTTWYGGRSSHTTNDDMKEAVRQCIVNGQRTIAPFVNEFCTFTSQYVSPYYSDTSQYVQGETKVTQLFGGNPTGTFWDVDAVNGGGNIFFYTDESYKNYCESQYTITGSGASNSNTYSVKSLDDFLFIGDSLTYGLKASGNLSEANMIGVIGSSATHWLQWMEGKQTKWDSNIDFTDITLPTEDQINGVCIMLGVNALGGNNADTAIQDMKNFLNKIKQRYPNKPIYVERVLPTRNDSFITTADKFNSNIPKYNEEISKFCSENGLLYIDTSDGYIASDGQLAEDKSADGVHLKEYDTLANNIKNEILNTNVTNNSNNPQVDTSGLEEFSEQDKNYYGLLYSDKSINRVDLANARPENYLQYLKKGGQYANHVGYSRGYLAYAYDELKRLFNNKFAYDDTLPFVYGSTLGYKTYDAEDILEAGTVSGTQSGGAISGNIATIPGAVQVPDGLGKVHTWTIWNHVNEQYNPESTWPASSNQGKLILHLTNNNERSLHGELSGDITANSKRMVCYGEWLASAMVSELGGTQGNPEKKLQVGDFVFIIQDNGTFYPVILTDTKVQFNATYYDPNPANEWGHDNGQTMVEFQGYTSSWRDVPSTPEEFNHYIKQVYVVGNVYTNPEYLNDIEKAAKDVGLDPANLINPKTM